MKETVISRLKIFKTVLYIALGAIILIFNEKIMDFVGVAVGSVVILFGVDLSIVSFIEKRFRNQTPPFFDGAIQIFIGIILIIVRADIVKVCLVWAIWSILREGKEMSVAFHEILHEKRGFVNIAESVVLIVFSFTMIMEPTEHHAHFHVYLLGIELILEVFFPLANEFIDRRREKRRERLATEVENASLTDTSEISDAEETSAPTDDDNGENA